MKKFSQHLAVTAAVLVSVGASQAAVITFEEPVDATTTQFAPFAPLLGNGDEFYQAGFWLDPFSNAPGALPGDLVGALVNGLDVANTCWSLVCPTNNPTTFYTSLNDGVLALGRQDALPFKVKGFDASFLGASGEFLAGVPGLLRLQGIKTDGTGSMTQTYQLPGPASTGALGFASYLTSGAFSNTEFDYLYAFGFFCNATGSCTAFASDKAQFALDNINLTVIPEPGSLALVGLGLAGIAALTRRRRGGA
jgi:hypothetical protein